MADPAERGAGILGGVMLVVGVVLFATVMAADVGGTPRLEALAMHLGLAVAPLMMAVAIALSLTGGWLVWRARARR